jgi:hypothetical protein
LSDPVISGERAVWHPARPAARIATAAEPRSRDNEKDYA